MTRPLPTGSARPRARWIIAVVAVGVAVLAGSAPVLGKILRNTIDATASLHAGGRVAEGVVLVACTPGERVKLKLTFTQGAVIGEGRTQGECAGEGELARYPVKVVARGAARFQAGPAEACAVAVNTDRGKVVDTEQW
ncbi:MAG: hypothetical protein ACREMC_04870, partial [Gemmatimonadales bacterium]